MYSSPIFDGLWFLTTGQLEGISVIFAEFSKRETWRCIFEVSNSAEFRSFLLNMCIDAPESTTNSLSSGFIADGAGRHQTSVSEKKEASHVSAGTSLLSLSLFLRPILKFWRVRNALMNHSERWTFACSDVCVTQRSFGKLHSSNSFQDFCALPCNR